jgi:hypothetical protein
MGNVRKSGVRGLENGRLQSGRTNDNGVRLMATISQIKRLRADLGANETSLPTSEANDIFDEAGESYTAAAGINAYARVIAIRRLMASAAKLTTYRQNQSSENASDVFKHLKELLTLWEGNLSKISAGSQSVVGSGRTRVIPRRIGEFPNDGPRRLVR